MRVSLPLAIVFIIFCGILRAENREFEVLKRCISTLESDINYYQSFLPAVVWRLDPYLHHLLKAYPVFKENEILLKANLPEGGQAKGPGAHPSIHLINNATESCLRASTVFRYRVRSFMELVILAPSSVFLAILFLILTVPWSRLTHLPKTKFFVPLALAFLGAHTRAYAEPLTVYTYDSFLGKGSIGEFAKSEFEKRTGLQVRYVPFGSAAEALNQIVIEGASTPAEVLIGIDNGLLTRAKESKNFISLSQDITDSLKPEALFDSERQFIPFDFGYLALIYDSDRIKGTGVSSEPQSLKEFVAQAKLSKKIVIEDPRTSSIGLGFLIWTRSLYKDEAEWAAFWKGLSSKLLTVSPGWSAAYGLFLKKEADWVLSYTTSPAYHIEKENKKSVHALALTDLPYAQVEGAGIVRFTKRAKIAQQFLEVLLGAEVQNKIAMKQWMYPVLKSATVPKSFPKLSGKQLTPEFRLPSEKERKEWLRKWDEIVSNSK